MKTPIQLKVEISETYATMLKETASCCEVDCSCGDNAGSLAGYPTEVLAQLPEGVVTFGCGNPVALASMQPGETVLDLGSGAGLDCFLAAQQVGESGAVIGVDFTQDMLDRAEENASKLGLKNVTFKKGDIEALPLEDATVDVVMSNCVVNLAPDKDAVFREAYRVLSTAGRVIISDIVLTRSATEAEKEDMALMTGCISGSLPVEEYAQIIRNAGFQNVKVERSESDAIWDGQFWYSASISATKI
jgi:arsenite methyltransferase